MPLTGFSAWIQSGGGEFVTILSFKSGTAENYGVNRNIKWWWMCRTHASIQGLHVFIFIQLQAQPLNSYILISAEIEQQSEEGAEADRLGKRRLAAEAFAVVCHFRGESNSSWNKGTSWSWSRAGGKKSSIQRLSRWECKIMFITNAAWSQLLFSIIFALDALLSLSQVHLTFTSNCLSPSKLIF